MITNQAKQVAAFEKLLGACNAHGAVYNPSKASMKVAALNTMLTSAQQTTQAVKDAKAALALAINVRQAAFDTVPKLGTRIINALAATDASPKLIEDANLIRLRFRSLPRPVSQPLGEGNAVINPSASTPRGPISQLDYDTKLENLYSLIRIVSSEPSYKPNEADLQVVALNTLLTGLRDKHKAVAVAQLALSNVRISRDNVLYKETGIHGTSKSIKKYIRSVFGATSVQYRQIQGLKFTKRAN